MASDRPARLQQHVEEVAGLLQGAPLLVQLPGLAQNRADHGAHPQELALLLVLADDEHEPDAHEQ